MADSCRPTPHFRPMSSQERPHRHVPPEALRTRACHRPADVLRAFEDRPHVHRSAIRWLERYVEWWRTGAYSVNGRVFDVGMATSAALLRFVGYRPDDIYLTTGPLYHSGPGGFMGIAFLLGHSTIVQRKFDPVDWLRLVFEDDPLLFQSTPGGQSTKHHSYRVSADASARNQASIEVSHQIQLEDDSICLSVQRGLRSRAYTSGRLSVRREAGEHLFHRLLHNDLKSGIDS